MIRVVIRRLFEAVPVLFVIVTLTFFLIRLAPGGPFDREKAVPEEIKKRIEAYYNLDGPLIGQYADYLADLLRGNLGPSFKNSSYSVNEMIGTSFPVSLELGFYALCIALTAGLILGVIAALRPNTLTDYVPMSLAMVGICVPTFVLGPLLVLFFGLHLHWMPVSGWDPLFEVYFLSDSPKVELHLDTLFNMKKILPSVTLAAMYTAYVARLARGGMLEILANDFIRTARAKGLSETRVVLRHALRGGIAPVVSFLGPAAAGLLSGSFVVETIFQIPGLGRQFVESAFNRDYTMIIGTVLFYATLIIVFNMIVDLLHTWLDPRLRHA